VFTTKGTATQPGDLPHSGETAKCLTHSIYLGGKGKREKNSSDGDGDCDCDWRNGSFVMALSFVIGVELYDWRWNTILKIKNGN
jgi:hypothetical protein